MIATMNRIIATCFFLLIPSLAFAAVITGGETVYRVTKGDSLLVISAKLGVDTATIVRENKLDPSRRLQPGQELRLNTRKIAPKVVDNGIIVDIPGRMLYYFKAGKLEMFFPVGLRMPKWREITRGGTPAGGFLITGKEEKSRWDVPQ